MQIVAVLLLGLLQTPTVAAMSPQTGLTFDPGFTLQLHRGRPRGEFPKGTQTLTVRMTNTSNEVIREDACTTAGKMYRLKILYNGVQLEEPEWRRKSREAAELGEAHGGDCPAVSNPARQLRPGESLEDFIFYDAARPGTYEFAIEEKVFSLQSRPRVLKSNTLTIVVRATPKQ